jgi:peptidoglycan hydrolase-like protein with peptidoglycan-binding domain
MNRTYAAPRARLGPPVPAMALALLALLAMPAPARASAEPDAMASAGWHGRAIQDPRPRPRLERAAWPEGWSAGPVGYRTGYVRPGGSKRVREVQRRLRQLGYRPGPVDGLFGPRTRAATTWFQYKHGLRTSGRINRYTLAVLKARSNHEPLQVKQPVDRTDTEARAAVAPLRTPSAVPAADESSPLALALLLMLLAAGLGVIVGFLGPELRRRRTAGPGQPVPAAPVIEPTAPLAPPACPSPARSAPPVLGYATASDGADAHAAIAAVMLRCARRGWSLVEVIHDDRDAGRRLRERPGLRYAIEQIRSGSASGLVVARLRDVTNRVSELAALLRWLGEAGAFLGAADHELDTSTRAGKATARAVIALGRWERRLVSKRARDGAAPGRFTPRDGYSSAELTRQIAVMHQRGISLRAITDALNLAGFTGPEGRDRWHTTDVKAVADEVHRT